MEKTRDIKKFSADNLDLGFEFGKDITPNLRGLDIKKKDDSRNTERLNLSIYPGE